MIGSAILVCEVIDAWALMLLENSASLGRILSCQILSLLGQWPVSLSLIHNPDKGQGKSLKFENLTSIVLIEAWF